jgi:ankyrin repeat protein
MLNESMNSDSDNHTFSETLLHTVKDISVLSKELEAAVDASDPDRVIKALERGANPNNFHSGRPESLLMSACFNGDLDVVLCLLRGGADPNQGVSDTKRNIQITPLMIAAETGMTDLVSELLRANADPHLRNSNGETALLAAARTNNHDAFAMLVGSMVSSTAP